MILYTVVLLASVPWQILGEVATSEEISRINSLGGGQGRPVTLDPRLRRALLRVLTRLEEADSKNQQHQESARNIAEVMQNIVTEDDFVRYFQEHGLEQELVEEFQPNDFDNNENNPPRHDEILSFSSEDSKPSEKPFTFASYPEDKKETTTQDVLKEIQNQPATNPTPSQGEAIYFQIPEPIRVPDAVNEEEEKGGFNLQETRSIQGPTFPSPSGNVFIPQEEEKLTENKEQQIELDNTSQPDKEEPSINFIPIRVQDGPVKIDLQKGGEEDDNADTTSTAVDFHASNVTEVENTEDSENSTMKVKMEKHEVEFLQSSLLTAFTVQQDQQGLPRRVIPLNYQLSGDPIPLPNNKNQPLNSLKEGRNELEQQIKFLQGHHLQEQQYKKLQDFVQQRQRLLVEEAQRQQYRENQKRQLENAVRLQQQQQNLFQQPDNQLDILKEIERQRVLAQQQQSIQHHQQNIVHQNNPQNHFSRNNGFQNTIPQNNIQQNNAAQNNFLHNGLLTHNGNQNQHQQNFQHNSFQQFQSFQPQFPQNQPQTVNFQKSVDFQFQPNFQQQQAQLVSSFQHNPNNLQQPFNSFAQPSAAVDLNRVNRHEPSNFVGNFGVSSQQNQNVNFQPSVSVELNRVNRQESSNFIGNFGVSQPQNQNFNFQGRSNYQFSQPSNYLQQQRIPPPLTLDSQLQSLFSISGIANGKPQEDLNIISKVLALGHPEQEVLGRQQFQASTIHEHVVKPPSRVIEPPTL